MHVPSSAFGSRPASALLAAVRDATPPPAAAAREALLRRQLLALFTPEPTGQLPPRKLS